MTPLRELSPGILTSLGVDSGGLLLPSARRVCLLLVDGLGDLLLAEHAALAPTLIELRHGGLQVPFPSSTPTSLATLSTGEDPGGHGVVGVTTLVDGEPLTTLSWQFGDEPATTAPTALQARPTLFERVTAAGLPAVQVTLRAFEGSGFTEAIWRGSDFRGLRRGDRLADAVLDALAPMEAGFVFGYTPALDTAGHRYGAGSGPWCEQLEVMDTLVRDVRDRLPADTLLLVTGDHGMVTPTDRLDLDDRPDLLRDVDAVTGEPRAVHLHSSRPAAVAERWRAELGDRATVALRAEALTLRWFGDVRPELLARLGDVVVRCGPELAVVRTQTEPLFASLVGMHGGVTDAEVYVPLLLHAG